MNKGRKLQYAIVTLFADIRRVQFATTISQTL